MFVFADVPTMGLWFGLPIAALVGSGWLAAGGLVCAALVVVGASFAMWPWKHDYHFWVNKSGVVKEKSSRLISDGDHGMKQRIVVVLDDGQPYGVDDTRAALLKRGDRVRLRCKPEYDFGSSDNGWACKWGGTPTPTT